MFQDVFVKGLDPRSSETFSTVLAVKNVTKSFGDKIAVDRVSLDVPRGSFYGFLGPNGAGKTTTLSMATGLLRPDSGQVFVNGIDLWLDRDEAKKQLGVLPDKLRLFDRLTGLQLLHYAGALRKLDKSTLALRSRELIVALGLEDVSRQLVADYSAGMTKKIALGCALIHAPRVLVLDEPLESIDPVSANNLVDILKKYVAAGGTVIFSSHSLALVEKLCDRVAIVVNGRVTASGTLDEVRDGTSLDDRFEQLAGGRKSAEGMEWLHSFSA